MSRSVEILAKLCDAVGVSGFEDDVREVVRRMVEPLVNEMYVDALGNLVAVRNAPREENPPTLMIAAHLDEIGFVVSHVEASGYLRFALVGGWDERVLPAQRVVVRTRDRVRHHGVIGTVPPHIQKGDEKAKPYPADSLFIDVGARSRDEVRGMGIRVGDSAVPLYPFTEMHGGAVMGKALDDRAGCAVLVRVLEELAADPLPNLTVAAVFTTFEEMGARGAHVAAFSIRPQVALVLEGTVAADMPGVPESRNPSVQGRGPAITLMDRTTHCHPRVTALLEEIAERDGIPWQHKTPIFGGTDGARIHMSRGGVPTGVVSVPCRYIHSPTATLRVEDLDNAVRLATAFARECRQLV